MNTEFLLNTNCGCIRVKFLTTILNILNILKIIFRLTQFLKNSSRIHFFKNILESALENIIH